MAGLILRPLDVVWIFDRGAIDRRTGQSGKWKAVVCLANDPTPWRLFRINSVAMTRRGPRPGSVLLPRATHPFLDHDSYLYCGGPPWLGTDADLAEAMAPQREPRRRGIVGRIAADLVPDIRREITASAVLDEPQRQRILTALDRPIP